MAGTRTVAGLMAVALAASAAVAQASGGTAGGAASAAKAGDGAAAVAVSAAGEHQAARPRPAATPRPKPRALPGLPAYTAGFERWLRLTSKPIPPDSADSRRVGFDAHRSVKRVYVNRTRAQITRPNGRQRLPYPNGTVIIKTGRTGNTITLVAVMRKIAGSDPAHGNWKYIEWKRARAGQPFVTNAGLRDATCWGCHGLVKADDWVFTGLE